MILGIGTDLLDCRRLERPLQNHKDRFLAKLLNEKERQHIEGKISALRPYVDEAQVTQHFLLQLGKTFAAKEAFVKALGTGFREGLGLLDMEVRRNTLGKPFIYLHSKGQEVFQQLIPEGMEGSIHLSLSDEFPYVQAFVTLSAR